MGAEADLSPPEPEPDIRGHDNTKSLRADMMSALGDSVSFGRFLSEPLDWGKWSAFAHNRYLEEAARQARPGSVAQKKALFEARYARKRKVEDEADANADEGAEGGYEEDLAAVNGAAAASLLSSPAGSSCMTDEAGPGKEVCGGGSGGGNVDDDVECGPGAGDALAGVATEKVNAVNDGVGAADQAADKTRNSESDELQSKQKQDLCNDHLVSDNSVEKHALKESPIVNQDTTDSSKNPELQIASLLQKPAKVSAPSSLGKKGHPSSVKRQSALHSSKENASPPNTDGSMQSTTPVPKRRSTLAALHVSMSFSRCETNNAAWSSRNLGTTVAERINQLQSTSRPVENSQPEEFRAPRKVSCRALQEMAPKASQVVEQRSSHVMRVKQKLFGSRSPSVTPKIRSPREKQNKPDNEPGFKELQHSFCFKARPLPNFCWKIKKAKDSNQQDAQEIQHLPKSSYLMNGGVNDIHQMDKGIAKEKQICCFPIRKLY